jgi:hypothetical protein
VTKIFQLFFENLAKFSEEVKIFLQNIPSLFLFFAFWQNFAPRSIYIYYGLHHNQPIM